MTETLPSYTPQGADPKNPYIPSQPNQPQLQPQLPPQSQAQFQRQPSPGPQIQYRFPQTFGFYHASGTTSDLVLALHKDDPNPIYYVSTHTWSSQPSVVLHSSPFEASPPLATADFHSFSNDISCALFVPPHPQPTQLVEAERSGTFSSATMYQVAVPGNQQEELFEWKNSSGPEVQRLQGRSHGMKCVRASTGEVVAVWTRANDGYSKRGKMAFVGNREALGERFEILSVVVILGIMEKTRRRRGNNRSNGVNSMNGF